MNKKHKIMDYNYKQFFPFFILIIAIVIPLFLKADPDFYFIIENGKKILADGFPYIDWMSMHENLHVIIQQWIPAVIYFSIYKIFGFYGIFFIVMALIWSIFLILYKICLLKSNKNYLITYICTLAATIFVSYWFCAPRPQLFSLIFVLLSIYCSEKYLLSRNKKYLLILPIISLLQANCHSTFWLAVIGTLSVYFIYSLVKIKKIDIKYMISIMLAILVGLINPYGIDGLIQPLGTLGYPLYQTISELLPCSPMMTVLAVMPILCIVVILIRKNFIKNTEYNFLPLLILYGITMVGMIFSLRLMMFHIPIAAILICSLLPLPKNSLQIQVIPKKEDFQLKILLGVAIIVALFLNVVAFIVYPETWEKTNANLQEIADIIQQEEQFPENKTILYSNVAEGQYIYHKCKIKSYMDGRLETYIDILNKKEDLSTPWYNLYKGKANQKEFINKYNFDYLCFEQGSTFDNVMEQNILPEYKLIYTTNNNSSPITYKLYKKCN